MKLYLANVTQQNQIVHYRLDYLSDGARDPRVAIPYRTTPPIPPGRQMPVGGDLAQSQVDSILDQLRPYGLIAQIDMNRLPRGRKVTYVSNVDREVSAEAIRQAHAHNQGVKVEDGRDRRKKAALGASEVIANVVQEQANASGAPAPTLNAFDISIEQEEQSEAGEPRLEEGIKVDLAAAAQAPDPSGGRRGRRGRAQA